MAEDAALELQKKHIALLRADVTLQGLIGQRVFDYVTRRTEYPYVVYLIDTSEEWDFSDADGEEHSITIHAYSDHEGSKEARNILNRVHELIQDVTTPVLTDHNFVNCRRTTKDMTREGQVYHGVALYRAVTEETA